MGTPCLCPSEGHKYGGRKVTETCHLVFLLKRKIITLELRHIERNVSSSASTVQLAKNKVITHLLTYTTAFSGHNFHVTQRKSVLYYNDVPVNSKTAHMHGPPRANPRAFDFFEKFWSNFLLCCQFRLSNAQPVRASRGSNPPPSRHVKATVETSSAKFSAKTNFVFSLSSLHTLNKGIFHDITI